jgi:hypothetical protein
MNLQRARQLLRQGIAMVQAGDRSRALELIEQAAQLEPYNEQAWLWLAGLSNDLDQRRFYLNQVLLINPQNQAALEGLDELRQKPQASLAQLSPLPLESSSGKETINLQTIKLQQLPDSQELLRNLSSDEEHAELIELIIKELRQHNARNNIILKIGQNHHLTWKQSEVLIDYVAELYKDRIERRTFQSVLLSPVATIAICLTLGIFGIFVLFFTSSLAKPPEVDCNVYYFLKECSYFRFKPLIDSLLFAFPVYFFFLFFLIIAPIVYMIGNSKHLSLSNVVFIIVFVFTSVGCLLIACMSAIIF